MTARFSRTRRMSADCRSFCSMIARTFAPCTSRLFWISAAACTTSLSRNPISLKSEPSTPIAAITSLRTRSLLSSIAARNAVPPASISFSTDAISLRKASACRPRPPGSAGSAERFPSPVPPATVFPPGRVGAAGSAHRVTTPVSTPPPTEESTAMPAPATPPTIKSGPNALAHSSERRTAGEAARSPLLPPRAACRTHSRTPACMSWISSPMSHRQRSPYPPLDPMPPIRTLPTSQRTRRQNPPLSAPMK